MEHEVKNPIIQKLLVSLKDMPRYLEERSKRLEHMRQFRAQVWEKACREAGLIRPGWFERKG